MPLRILSPSEAYGELIKHAAVVVEVRDSVQDILEWHPKSETKAGLFAFVDSRRRVSLLEISFGTATPYGRKERNPALYPREKEPIEITPFLWEYIKYVLLLLGEERCKGKKPFFLNRGERAGKRFWIVGTSLNIKPYHGYRQNGFRTPIRQGFLIGVGKNDSALLERFFAEEPESLYWRGRMGWFAGEVNRLTAGWMRVRRGLKAFRELVGDADHGCFFRREIFEALLHRIARPHLFLDALAECGRISSSDQEEFLRRLSHPCARKSVRERANVKLNFVFRGKRRNGTYRFEVFPEEERTREW